MNSQLYIAASGLLVEERRVELIANNLANLGTNGFRAQRSFSAIYRGVAPDAGPLLLASNHGVALAGAYEVPGPGPMRPTGRPLDVALGAESVLGVETADGRRYTRAGALQVAADGRLTDGGGRPVLDSAGRPIGGLTPAAEITADGRVLESGAERGRLLVLRDGAGVLQPEGDNLLSAQGRDAELETVNEPSLQPGWLEGSAADAMGELVLLIEAQRAFESYQRLISLTMNDINRKAVTELAG